MASFADGIGQALDGIFKFGCGVIVLLSVAVVTLLVLYVFNIRLW